MPLTSAQELRLRIQDIPAVFDHTYAGDGLTDIFNLPQRNITSATAFVAGSNGQWSATGATINPSGWVAFSGVVSAFSGFRVRGVHSVFADEEVDHRLGSEGGIVNASLAFAYDLLFDSVKRASWRASDGSEYDDTKAIEAVKALVDRLKTEQHEGAVGAGGFSSWAETQAE